MKAIRRAVVLALGLGLGLGAGAASAQPTAIGRINNSVGGHCTGVLVAQATAVTAAHCLYNGRTQRWLRPEAIHLLLGFDRGSFDFHGVVKSYRLSSAYDPARPIETLSGDFAILTLAEPAPEAIRPLPIEAPAPGAAHSLVPAGFAKARPYLLTQADPCVGNVSGAFLVSNCAVPEGFSGGPLLVPGSEAFAGISVATGRDRSVAIPGAVLQDALTGAQ